MSNTGQTTRFLLGHKIFRHSGRGCRWFTIDNDSRQFESVQLAVRCIRSMHPMAVPAR